ncbi:DUF2591 domain-containing protein [Edwardsiella tarda]|uniref:phage protein NinX family protein n=1 Tax=Edwardsiella tarda TaxID=636 RepID=UPI00351C251C
MNYAEMSDSDIAAKVFEAAYGGAQDYKESLDGGIVITGYERNIIDGEDIEMEVEYGVFNPCNNPADAWPLMEKKRIGLHPDAETGGWVAVRSIYKSKNVRNVKPFRAVAILFLMIEAEVGE